MFSDSPIPPPTPAPTKAPTTPAARAFVIFTAALVGTAILVVALLVGTRDNTEATKSQSVENSRDLADTKSILRIVLAVTGCTIDDTADACRAKAQASGLASIAEVDCRIRRAIEHQPAPLPGTTCAPLPVPKPTK